MTLSNWTRSQLDPIICQLTVDSMLVNHSVVWNILIVFIMQMHTDTVVCYLVAVFCSCISFSPAYSLSCLIVPNTKCICVK